MPLAYQNRERKAKMPATAETELVHAEAIPSLVVFSVVVVFFFVVVGGLVLQHICTSSELPAVHKGVAHFFASLAVSYILPLPQKVCLFAILLQATPGFFLQHATLSAGSVAEHVPTQLKPDAASKVMPLPHQPKLL